MYSTLLLRHAFLLHFVQSFHPVPFKPSRSLRLCFTLPSTMEAIAEPVVGMAGTESTLCCESTLELHVTLVWFLILQQYT